MHQRMAAFLERIEGCESIEDLYSAVCDLREAFQVDHVVYHSTDRDGQPYALATYGSEWAKYYEGEQLYRMDPVVLAAFQKFHPYSWKSLDWDKKPARKFLRDALDGGVGNQGLSVPVRGPHGEFALFTVNHQCSDEKWLSFMDAHLRDMLLMAHYLHQRARTIVLAPQDTQNVSLSPRENETLQLLCIGLNRARVAERLQISEHTLRVYIESARFKLGAANTTHAVAKAMSQGLISL